MSEYERLKKLLDQKPFLVADAKTGEVALVTQKSAFGLMVSEDGPFPTKFIANIGAALTGFAKLAGKEDREFGLREIAKIAGVSYHLCYFHIVKQRLFLPSIRPFTGSGKGKDSEGRFSWADAFTAGTVGCLRRAGFHKDVLKKVQPLFCKSTKKRTPRKLTPSARP